MAMNTVVWSTMMKAELTAPLRAEFSSPPMFRVPIDYSYKPGWVSAVAWLERRAAAEKARADAKREWPFPW